MFEIARDAQSESVQVAAIKAIDAISRRMLEMLQSVGLVTTVSDESQIDPVLEGWARRDSLDLLYEGMRHDPGAEDLLCEANRAEHRGDLEAAEKLYAEFESRVLEWTKKKMHADMLELKS